MSASRLAVAAFREGYAAVSPYSCVKQALSIVDNSLNISASSTVRSFPLQPRSKVTVIAFGKASLAMAAAAEDALSDRFHTGAVLAPNGSPNTFSLKSSVFHGARNNLPDEDAVAGTQELLKTVEEGDQAGNTVLFLISGGGSALFCMPNGVTLEEKLETIRVLVGKGATIQQLNIVRQALSAVKGGRTLGRIKHAQVISLFMSDIIGDPVSLIASGPTVPPVSDVSPLSVLSSLSVSPDSLPPSVVSCLSQPTPPLPPDATPLSSHFIVANNTIALNAVASSLQAEGFLPLVVTSTLSGEAADRGVEFARLITANRSSLNDRLQKMVAESEPVPASCGRVALIFGGETTVAGAGRGGGLGGRCQHMVLSCLRELLSHPPPNHRFAFLAAGTDGQEGPTTAAGVVITEADLDADKEEVNLKLQKLDSFHFWADFKKGACHIITGKTGTNVMDVQILLLHYSE